MTHEPTLDLIYECLDYFADSNDNVTTPRDVALLKNKLDMVKAPIYFKQLNCLLKK